MDKYFGEDGFGDFYFPDLPSTDLIQKKSGVDALIEAVSSNPGTLKKNFLTFASQIDSFFIFFFFFRCVHDGLFGTFNKYCISYEIRFDIFKKFKRYIRFGWKR